MTFLHLLELLPELLISCPVGLLFRLLLDFWAGFVEAKIYEVLEVVGLEVVGVGEWAEEGTVVLAVLEEGREEEVGGRGVLAHNNCKQPVVLFTKESQYHMD